MLPSHTRANDTRKSASASPPASPAQRPRRNRSAHTPMAEKSETPQNTTAKLSPDSTSPLAERMSLFSRLGSLQQPPPTDGAQSSQLPVWLVSELQNLRMDLALIIAGVATWLASFIPLTFVWTIIIFLLLAFWSRLSLRRFAKQVAITSKMETLREQASEHGESALWFNNVMHTILTRYRRQVAKLVHEHLEDLLDESQFPGLESFKIGQIDLGDSGLQIVRVRTVGGGIKEKELSVEAQIIYNEPNSSIEILLNLGRQYFGLGMTAAVKVCAINLQAQVRCTVRFSDDGHGSVLSTAHAAILAPPTIEFGLVTLGAVDVCKTFPSLHSWLQKMASDAICNTMLYPGHLELFSSVSTPTMTGTPVRGVLLLTAENAAGLSKGSVFGVAMEMSGQATSTKLSAGPNPFWQEQHALLVRSLESDQCLVRLLRHRPIRRALVLRRSFRVNDLVTHGTGALDFGPGSDHSLSVRYDYQALEALPAELLQAERPVTDVKYPMIGPSDSDSTLSRSSSEASLHEQHAGVVFFRINRTALAVSGHGLRVSVVFGPRVLCVCAVSGAGKVFTPPLSRSWIEFFLPNMLHCHTPFELRLQRHEGLSTATIGVIKLRFSSLAVTPRLEGWIPFDSVRSLHTDADASLEQKKDKAHVTMLFRPVKTNANLRTDDVMGTPRRMTMALGFVSPCSIMPPRAGTLFIHIHEARNLPSRHGPVLGGTCNPFVVVQLNGDPVFRSDVLMKTSHPVWSDTCFEAPVRDLARETVRIICFDKDLTSEDVLGETTLMLDGVVFQDKPQWFKLTGGAGDACGLEICVTLKFKSSSYEEPAMASPEAQATTPESGPASANATASASTLVPATSLPDDRSAALEAGNAGSSPQPSARPRLSLTETEGVQRPVSFVDHQFVFPIQLREMGQPLYTLQGQLHRICPVPSGSAIIKFRVVLGQKTATILKAEAPVEINSQTVSLVDARFQASQTQLHDSFEVELRHRHGLFKTNMGAIRITLRQFFSLKEGETIDHTRSVRREVELVRRDKSVTAQLVVAVSMTLTPAT